MSDLTQRYDVIIGYRSVRNVKDPVWLGIYNDPKFTLECLPHATTVIDTDRGIIKFSKDYLAWCVENCRARWHVAYFDYRCCMVFEDDVDAVNFRLAHPDEDLESKTVSKSDMMRVYSNSKADVIR